MDECRNFGGGGGYWDGIFVGRWDGRAGQGTGKRTRESARVGSSERCARVGASARGGVG